MRKRCSSLLSCACAPGPRPSLVRSIRPMPTGKQARRAGRVDVSRAVEQAAFRGPDTLHLRDLLLERHATQEVGDAGLDAGGRVAVEQAGYRRRLSCLCARVAAWGTQGRQRDCDDPEGAKP